MPGNEQYPGAKRRFAKKGPTTGSGGKRRRGLEGRGPTPKAEDRVGHPKARAKARAEARAAQPTHAKRLDKARDRFDVPAGHEVVCGRNAVAEAARAGVPITRVFMASSAASSGSDDRLGAVVRRATLLGAPVLEATRLDLEALTDGAAHQGVAIEVPAYEYADARDLLERAREAGRTPLLVALDQVTDPHNLGAVLRNAGAFGADGVIIPERRSVGVNTTVWKVSSGSTAVETRRSRTSRSPTPRSSWSPGPRGRACPAWYVRPATSSPPSRSPAPSNRSTRRWPPASACTRSTDCAAPLVLLSPLSPFAPIGADPRAGC